MPLAKIELIVAAANHPHPRRGFGQQVFEGQRRRVRAHHCHLWQALQQDFERFDPVGVDVPQHNEIELIQVDVSL